MVSLVVDDGEFFGVQEGRAQNLVVGFARALQENLDSVLRYFAQRPLRPSCPEMAESSRAWETRDPIMVE